MIEICLPWFFFSKSKLKTKTNKLGLPKKEYYTGRLLSLYILNIFALGKKLFSNYKDNTNNVCNSDLIKKIGNVRKNKKIFIWKK